MSIITISRGTFSGGHTIAERVASDLGYECVSREVLIDAAKTYGVDAEVLASAIDKSPRFLDRLGRHRDHYVAFFAASLCEHALRGDMVYHGHAGHFLLTGVAHVLRLRVVAPMEYRIEAATKRLAVTRPEAVAYIDKVDKERMRWTRFLYGVDWDDPHHYDAVLNLEKMSIDTACDIVTHTVKLPDFRPTEQSRAAMRTLTTKCRVVAALAADPRTADANIDVLVGDERVTLQGWVRMPGALAAIGEVVRAVESVTSVDNQVVVRTGFPI